MLSSGCGSQDAARVAEPASLGDAAVISKPPAEAVGSGQSVKYRQAHLPGPPLFARVDPQSGKIAWRALACLRPGCGVDASRQEPRLFANVIEGVTISPDQLVRVPESKTGAPLDLPVSTCPVCGASGTVIVPYEAPERVRRRQELEAELGRVRGIRSAAERSGQPPPTDVRTPARIMQEMSDLPQVYLIVE
jgi:hypothetical protein